MKRLLLLLTIITLVWSCEKDDNELTYEEVVQRLEIEKAKVNQDSLIAIIEGDWYGMNQTTPTHLIFSSNPKNFKEINFESTEREEIRFNVNDYFFVKVDPDPGVYRLVSFHNRFGGRNPDCYAFLKITKETIVYSGATLPPEAKDDVNMTYECIMAKSREPFDEEFGAKLQRKKQGL